MTADEITAALAQSVIENAHRAGTLDRHGERFDIQIIADLDTIAGALGIELDHNRPVRIGSKAYLPATRQHLTDLQLAEAICSGSLQVLIEHDGNPLWLGRTKRLFTRAQRRALAHRAGGHVCEIPGCGRSRYIEAHHIERYEVGGRTDLDNGILVCTEHHEKIHRHKWRIVCNGANHTIYDGDRCLGTTGPPSQHPAQPSGPPPDLSQLPFVEHLPTPITKITGDTPRSTGGGEPLTRYALDTFLNHLLAG